MRSCTFAASAANTRTGSKGSRLRNRLCSKRPRPASTDYREHQGELALDMVVTDTWHQLYKVREIFGSKLDLDSYK